MCDLPIKGAFAAAVAALFRHGGKSNKKDTSKTCLVSYENVNHILLLKLNNLFLLRISVVSRIDTGPFRRKFERILSFFSSYGASGRNLS